MAGRNRKGMAWPQAANDNDTPSLGTILGEKLRERDGNVTGHVEGDTVHLTSLADPDLLEGAEIIELEQFAMELADEIRDQHPDLSAGHRDPSPRRHRRDTVLYDGGAAASCAGWIWKRRTSWRSASRSCSGTHITRASPGLSNLRRDRETGRPATDLSLP